MAGLQIRRKLPSNTGAVETWSTIDKWIQDCSKHHRCMAGLNANWYPARLVERLQHERFRVIRSDSILFQLGSGQRYITLSHRWGDGDFLKLTTDNLSTLENGLPVSHLRKAFQESLIVAERMNISYVWIDSLCIIQSGDDQADWQEQSKTMERVYSNSFCNVSADWGDESNGLFFERTPTLGDFVGTQTRRKFATSHGKHNSLAGSRRTPRLKPAAHRWHPVRSPDLFEDLTTSPLNHRGWVLQERLLAPRVLHFLPTQVTWECAESLAYEKAPAFLDETEDYLARTTSIKIDYYGTKESMQRLSFSDDPGYTRASFWLLVVNKYTQSDLTRISDKLVAISGIARQLAKFEGQYVAGLWVRSMPRALLWKARIYSLSTNQSHCEPPVEYYAPTFSWAAAGGEVVLDSARAHVLLTTSTTFIKHRDKPLSSADETVLTYDLFGPLSAPIVEVRVRGMLRSCWRVAQKLVPADWWEHTAVDALPDERHHACLSSRTNDHDIGLCFEAGRALEVSYDRLSDAHDDTDRTMYCYTIIGHSLYSGIRTKSNSPCWSFGLLLRSVDASMARFARVGYVSHSSSSYNNYADIRGPLGNERDLPAWDYDEATGEHTFYIV